MACEIAQKIKANGHNLDIDFIEVAALTHDIGRARTHGIEHGIIGAKIMAEHPRYARVCERHLGGGIKKEEAQGLGLPDRDYMPETLEEKIICYADKLVEGTERITIEQSLEKFSNRLGPDHPGVERIRELDRQMRELIGYSDEH